MTGKLCAILGHSGDSLYSKVQGDLKVLHKSKTVRLTEWVYAFLSPWPVWPVKGWKVSGCTEEGVSRRAHLPFLTVWVLWGAEESSV